VRDPILIVPLGGDRETLTDTRQIGQFVFAKPAGPIGDEYIVREVPLADKVCCSILRRRMPSAQIAHSNDFKVLFATSIKARNFGAREARRG
jgi:hypothetical protein